MKHIEQAIGDLLLRHNCVIVPAFGGFVAEQLSAKIDYDKGIMLPPRKSLLFNKQLISNDGLLINELAKRGAFSFEEANRELSGVVSEWNHRLKKGERIELDRVGILFLDAENNLRFEQDRFFNLLLASFGLDQIHFITEKEVEGIRAEAVSIDPIVLAPVLVEVEDEAIPVETVKRTLEPVLEPRLVEAQPEAKIIPIAQPKSSNRRWKYVAAACFLPIAFYSFWIPMRTEVLESGMLSIKDFNPFYTAASGVYAKTDFSKEIRFEKNTEQTFQEYVDGLEVRPAAIPYEFIEGTNIFVRLDQEDAEIVSEPTPVVEEKAVPTPTVQPKGMNVIVGCFGSSTNANNLVAKLKQEGLNAYILDVRDGLHRVSAGAALSEEALKEIMDKTAALGFKGWVPK
jgi:hypothetical protein